MPLGGYACSGAATGDHVLDVRWSCRSSAGREAGGEEPQLERRQPERIIRLVQPDLVARAWATARATRSDVALADSAAPPGGGTAATTDPARRNGLMLDQAKYGLTQPAASNRSLALTA